MVLFDQQPQRICLVEAWKQIDLSDLSEPKYISVTTAHLIEIPDILNIKIN